VPQARLLAMLKRAVTGSYPFVGGAQAEFKITDSMTGEILAVGVDRRIGGGRDQHGSPVALGRCRECDAGVGEAVDRAVVGVDYVAEKSILMKCGRQARKIGTTVPSVECHGMDLNEILVFARVVQRGSFTAAAAQLDMPKSTVSRKVSDLEAATQRASPSADDAQAEPHARRPNLLRSLRAHRGRGRRRGARGRQLAGRATWAAPRDVWPQLGVPRPDHHRLLEKVPRGHARARVHALVRSTLSKKVSTSVFERARCRLDTDSEESRASALVFRRHTRVPEEVRPAALAADLAKQRLPLFRPGLGDVGPWLEKNGDVVRLTVSPRMTVNEMDILHAVALADWASPLFLRFIASTICAP